MDTISQALSKQGETLKALERWKAEMPREEEMLPKDKYTIFDRKEKKYRKGIHSTLLPSIHTPRTTITSLLCQRRRLTRLAKLHSQRSPNGPECLRGSIHQDSSLFPPARRARLLSIPLQIVYARSEGPAVDD